MKFLVVLVLASAALAAPLPPAGPAFASASDNYPTYAVRSVDNKADCDNATAVSAESVLDDVSQPLFRIIGPLIKPLVGGILPPALLKPLFEIPLLGGLLSGLLGGGASAASVESYDFKNGTELEIDRDELAAAEKVLAVAAKELSSAFASISAADEGPTETVTSTVTDAAPSTAAAADVGATETESWSMTESSPAAEPTDVDFSFSAHIGEGMKGARML